MKGTVTVYLSQLRGRWNVLVHDLIMIPLAWLGAYWLRYNLGTIPEHFLDRSFELLPIVIAVQCIFFIAFGLYRGVWRFASVPDLLRIVKAVFFGTAMIAISIFFVTRLQHVPRSVFVLYGILLVGFLGGPRIVYRIVKDRHLGGPLEKVIIVGAGAAGELLVRDLLRSRPRVFDPVAFVDDDPEKNGKEIHGVRVIGGAERIPEIATQVEPSLILLALPTASTAQIRRIVEFCEQTKCRFRMLPKLQDLVTGQVNINELRHVEIDDLLGREPVSLDWRQIREGLRGKRILVTGGGGSIGAELCRQLAGLSPGALILLERTEFNLYSTELELRRKFPALELHGLLGDVGDRRTVDHLFTTHHPDIVFHAAAYKHVPMLEEQPREAARNNVLGTRTLARAADRWGCDAFVMISTDKAVNPGNLMGASKRVAEIFCQSLDAVSKTRCITVRFGNVLGSAGSVVPLFRKQIAEGGPVTVTHPEITRYFMTTSEATQLILQASVMARGGEIFVLDMGEPVRIRYLAEQMIRLSGKRPDEDIEITYTGLRPGEKLHEELFHPDEELEDTGYQKIRRARSRRVDPELLDRVFSELETACDEYDEPRIRQLLRTLVPEYGNKSCDEETPAIAERAGV